MLPLLWSAYSCSDAVTLPGFANLEGRKPTHMDYQTAINQLRYPEQWCQAAQALTVLGDRRALIPLLQAYETPTEISKLCLLDALEELNAGLAAPELLAHGNATERRWAMHLMELFPNPAYLPYIEQAVADTEPQVRQQARRTLAVQKQTPDWEALLIRLLSSGDRETQTQAFRSLSRRRTETAQTALKEHLRQEPDPDQRQVLEQMLQPTPHP